MGEMADLFIEEDEQRQALEWQYAILKLIMDIDCEESAKIIQSQLEDVKYIKDETP